MGGYNINTLEKTKQILKKNNIKANKRFGQNFLIDDNILENIVETANVLKNDLVIEIGPGLGNLTNYLIKCSKHVMLIEIDTNMIDILKNRFEKDLNYTLIREDVLNIDIDEEIEKIENKINQKFENVKVVANLPYYITTPIIFKLLQDSKRVSEITVMVQKEVAQRMVANKNSKAYGILTLMVEYLSDAKIKMEVPNTSFIPSPEVTSAVVRLVKSKKYVLDKEEEKILYKLIHSSFAQRRKKIINSLESTKFLDMSKEELKKLLELCKLKETTRAQELDLQEYINIVKNIKKYQANL
ncbi:MAG: 16S rRNA (adenine(1518)-N(6)/adenine(1519)-N(6))-dimethyltransferase RsmA [Clostridia bacterium]